MSIIKRVSKFIRLEEELNLTKLTLILSWILVLFSITFNPRDFLAFSNYIIFENFFFTNFDFIKTVILINGVLSLLFFPIVIFIFFRFNQFNKMNRRSKIIFITLIFYFLTQFVGLVITENIFYNSFFLINSLTLILILYISTEIFSEKDFEIILHIIFWFLMLILFFYSFNYFKNYFISSNNLYSVWGNIKEIMSLTSPRPTGLSRTAAIILIFSAFYYTTNNLLENFRIFLISFCISIVILLGSRTSMGLILIFLLCFLIISINGNKLQIKKFIKNYIFFPFLLISFILLTKFSLLQLVKYGKLTLPDPDDYSLDAAINSNLFKKNPNERTFAILLREYPDLENTHSNNFSSGRLEDWANIINFMLSSEENKIRKYKFRPNQPAPNFSTVIKLNIPDDVNLNMHLLFGFGVQGDRFIIGQSASNVLVYAFASGGIIGLILLIIFSIYGLYLSLNCIFTVNKKKFSWYHKASSTIILIILARSLLESSYAVFGIDLILFAMCTITLNQKYNKIL